MFVCLFVLETMKYFPILIVSKTIKGPFVEGLGVVAEHDSQGVPLTFANQGTFWFFYVKDFFLQTFHGNLILFEN